MRLSSFYTLSPSKINSFFLPNSSLLISMITTVVTQISGFGKNNYMGFAACAVSFSDFLKSIKNAIFIPFFLWSSASSVMVE